MKQKSYAVSLRDISGTGLLSGLSSLSDPEDDPEELELDELLDMDKVFFNRFFHFSIIRTLDLIF